MNKTYQRVLSVLFSVALLYGCGEATRNPQDVPVSKYEIVQTQFLRLQSGMAVEEVRDIMGQPQRENLTADIWFPDPKNNTNQLKVIYAKRRAVRAIWISPFDRIHFILFG